MATTLERQCEAALHARSLSELRQRMIEFANARDFAHVSATMVIEHSPSLKEYRFITSADSGWMPEFEDMEAARRDPVSQHAALRSDILVWDQATYVSSGEPALWEHQAPWGYRSGLVMAFHLPRGRKFLFGPDSDRPKCVPQKHSVQILEEFYLFAAYAQAAAFELFQEYDPPAFALPYATRGELEALRWSMDGLAEAEIGDKLGLSALDVRLRLQCLMRKWNCGTKYEAVLKGLRLGHLVLN